MDEVETNEEVFVWHGCWRIALTSRADLRLSYRGSSPHLYLICFSHERSLLGLLSCCCLWPLTRVEDQMVCNSCSAAEAALVHNSFFVGQHPAGIEPWLSLSLPHGGEVEPLRATLEASEAQDLVTRLVALRRRRHEEALLSHSPQKLVQLGELAGVGPNDGRLLWTPKIFQELLPNE